MSNEILTESLRQLDKKILDAAHKRLAERYEKIEEIKLDACQSKIATLEPEKRLKTYIQRKLNISDELLPDTAALLLEAQIGVSDDIISIEFLEAGLLAARPVGRVSVFNDLWLGSGFLVGKGLFLTNHHVLRTPDTAAASAVRFNYEDNKFGKHLPASEFFFKPEEFWLTNEDLDYTLVALSEFDDAGTHIDSFGWHPLKKAGKILQGMPVNIVQHPDGDWKSIALHNSHFLLVDDGSDADDFCWYTGDTRKGSSGSPVFSSDWEVVALHHKAIPQFLENGRIKMRGKDAGDMSEAEFQKYPEKAEYIANEGIRASRLLGSIESAALETAAQTHRRDELIALWSSDQARSLLRHIPNPQ